MPQPSQQESDDASTLRIAMAQILCIDGDRAGNLLRMDSAIQKAVQQEAQLVCLPEMALYGWVNPDAHQLAQPIPGRDSDALGALARKHGIYLCVGLAEKEGDQLYDSVILLDDQGKLLLKHRKMNILKELMDPSYTPGESIQTAETRWGRIGMLICADTFQRDVVTRMSLHKPDLLLVPYGWANRSEAWPQHGQSLKDTIAGATAITKCPVVGTNLVGSISHGPWKGQVYGGQSYAVRSDGKVIAQGKDREPDVIVFDLPRP